MKEIEIPEGYEARIEGNKVIIESIKDKDERIRKALLRCCDDWEKGQFGCMKSEDVPAIRAYLEKQKEQKPVTIVRIPKFRVGDIIQHVPLESWDSSRKIKAINKDGYYFDMSHLDDNVSGGFIGFSFEDEYELIEQKPTEWSEKENKMLASAIAHIVDSECFDHFYDITKEDIISWLKSLRPQPHWKPSKEQMDALKNSAYGAYQNGDGPELRSLYEQLKKL